jgi:hypothetical protein
LCLRDLVLVASNSILRDLCVCVRKGTVPINVFKELELGNAVIKLLSAADLTSACPVICSDRFVTSVRTAVASVRDTLFP